jgi:hypothetical protein
MNHFIQRFAGLHRTLVALATFAAAFGAAAQTTVFSNPFESVAGYSDSLQSTTVVSFTASSTGVLNGYFVGGQTQGGPPSTPVWYHNSVAVVLGDISGDRATLEQGASYGNTNYTMAFGDKVFNQINVTAGQKITFVLRADTNTDPSATNYNYIWSDERSMGGTWGSTTTNGRYGGTSTYNPNNAMAWTTSYTSSNTIVADKSCPVNGGSSRDCWSDFGTRANGTVAAGSYTFVGFNDAQGYQSNSYFDFAFLFNITCAPGTPGCSPTGSQVPLPSTLAMVPLALLAMWGTRRRRA